jgi:hypothetical protein
MVGRLVLVVVAFVVVIGIPAPAAAQSKSLIISDAVFITAQAADMYSTHRALSSGHGREANPFMNVGTGGQIAIKTAATIGVIALSHKLHARHPKVAKTVLLMASAGMFTIAANNYRIAQGPAR